MEKFPRHSFIGIQPILGITPEPLYAIDMASTLGSTTIFPGHDMISPYGKGTIGLPLVGVVKTGLVCSGRVPLLWKIKKRILLVAKNPRPGRGENQGEYAYEKTVYPIVL